MTKILFFPILVALSTLRRRAQAPLMAEKQFLEIRGTVLESLPAGAFRVKLETDMEVIAHLAGKLRQFRIRVMPGDDVKCEISPYDLTKARITFRF